MTFLEIFARGLIAAEVVSHGDVIALDKRIGHFGGLHDMLLNVLEPYDVGVLASLSVSVEAEYLTTGQDFLITNLHGRRRILDDAVHAVLWQLQEIAYQPETASV